ncbi:MAG: 6-phosphofructokinase [Gammaproteobacteria bacterium]
MKHAIQSIAVLCSGGDSPGMNCAIRAVVRTAIAQGLTVYGVQKGYQGLLENRLVPLDASSVGNIFQYGGTILQTSRSQRFQTQEGRAEAAQILKNMNIDALVVIGGNGSLNGAYKLHQEFDIAVAGVPGTIDNDIEGTDYTIGFNTAVQTAVEATDKIRDTAQAHFRTFVIEVMGRKSPAIALHVGMCTGAENIVFPMDLDNINIDQIAADIRRGIERGKESSIIIVAEGEKEGASHQIKHDLRDRHGIDSRVCILGHIQRGGSPTAYDRFRACQMGYVAVNALLAGDRACVAVERHGEVLSVPLSECLGKKYDVNPNMLKIVKTLSV